jgi:DNA-binding MarR family transcriptional regulator
LGYDLFVTSPHASPHARSRSSASDRPVSSADETWAQSSSVAAAIEASPPFRTVGFTLSSLGYAVSRRFRETLAPLDLEPREFALLRAVAAAEGQSQQALGERLLIPASRMVAFVDALQERGLLERQINPQDRRAHALHLTAAGRRLLGRAVTAASELERGICAELDDADRERLLELLQRVGACLGQPPGTHGAHSALRDELP